MQAIMSAMVACPNVTMRNKSRVHFITSFFQNNVPLLPFLFKCSFLGTMEDTRMMLFSC